MNGKVYSISQGSSARINCYLDESQKIIAYDTKSRGKQKLRDKEALVSGLL